MDIDLIVPFIFPSYYYHYYQDIENKAREASFSFYNSRILPLHYALAELPDQNTRYENIYEEIHKIDKGDIADLYYQMLSSQNIFDSFIENLMKRLKSRSIIGINGVKHEFLS